MPNEIQEKIKEIFKQIKSCAIILPEDAKEEVFLLSHALKLALEDAQKKVISLPEAENSLILKSHKEKWQAILDEKDIKEIETQFKTIIKIPKKDVSIKELAYNENEDFFSLVLTTNSALNKETAIFEKALPEPEAAICFFDDHQKLNDFKPFLTLPQKDKLMFLNSKSSLQNSDDADRKKTLTEKVINLTELLDTGFSQNILNLIFAALTIETNNFYDFAGKEIFSAANFLLGKGAEAKKINEILQRQKTNSAVQFMGRFMARTYFDEQLNVSWSFIPKKDFDKTGADPSPQNMMSVEREIEKSIKSAKTYVICWQLNLEIFSIIKSSSRLLEDLSIKFDASLNNDHLLLRHFKNFSEAEIKIKEALVELNANTSI